MFVFPNKLFFDLVLRKKIDDKCFARDIYHALNNGYIKERYFRILKKNPYIFRRYLDYLKNNKFIDYYIKNNLVIINKINELIYEILKLDDYVFNIIFEEDFEQSFESKLHFLCLNDKPNILVDTYYRFFLLSNDSDFNKKEYGVNCLVPLATKALLENYGLNVEDYLIDISEIGKKDFSFLKDLNILNPLLNKDNLNQDLFYKEETFYDNVEENQEKEEHHEYAYYSLKYKGKLKEQLEDLGLDFDENQDESDYDEYYDDYESDYGYIDDLDEDERNQYF